MELEAAGAVADAGAVAASDGLAAGAGEDLSSPAQTDLEILNEPDKPETDAAATDDAAKTDDAATDGAAKPEVKADAAADATKTDDKQKTDDAAKTDGEAEPEGERVKVMREAIEADAALKAALEANPKLRNMVYANARRAETLTKFQEHIKTPELARVAKEAAEDFGEYETEYYSGTPEASDSILDKMYRAQCERDAQGKLVTDKDGVPVSSGKYEAFLRHYRSAHLWPGVHEFVGTERGKEVLQQAGVEAEDVTNAIDLIKKVLGDPDAGQPARPAAAATAQGDKYANYSPDDRKKLEEYDRLKLQEANSGKEAEKQYSKEVKTEITTSVKGYLSKRVAALAPALSEAIRKKITDDAFSEIDSIAKADKLYRKQSTNYFRDRTADGRKNVAAHALEYAQSTAGPIVQRLVKEYGEPAVASSSKRVEKIEQQAKRAEPKSTGGVNEPSRQDDETADILEANKLSKQINGRALNDREILDVDEVLPKLRKIAQHRSAARA